ncbi:hypothetical protein [Rhizobium leguminosarum]|uniref:hypothetical protein n=1 Tax=Rhizobium leguminosarum TaxID=384 RepID=UPI003D053910
MIGCLASNHFAGIFAGLPASFCRDLPIALAAWKHQALSKGARNTIRKLDYENSGDQKLGAQDILKTPADALRSGAFGRKARSIAG